MLLPQPVTLLQLAGLDAAELRLVPASSVAVVRSRPGGNYRLLAHGDTGTWNGGAPPSYARIFIYERPAPVSNLLLAIGLIVLVVAVGVYRDARFEAARWEGSRFKPTGGKK